MRALPRTSGVATKPAAGPLTRVHATCPLTRARVITGRAWLAIRDRIIAQYGNRDAYYTVSSSVTVADKGEHCYMISGGGCCAESLVSVPAYLVALAVAWDWLYLVWLQAMSHGVTIPLKKRYTAGSSAV